MAPGPEEDSAPAEQDAVSDEASDADLEGDFSAAEVLGSASDVVFSGASGGDFRFRTSEKL